MDTSAVRDAEEMRSTYDKEMQRLDKMWNEERSKMEKKLAEANKQIANLSKATVHFKEEEPEDQVG